VDDVVLPTIQKVGNTSPLANRALSRLYD
jgi:hypothetical protein